MAALTKTIPLVPQFVDKFDVSMATVFSRLTMNVVVGNRRNAELLAGCL